MRWPAFGKRWAKRVPPGPLLDSALLGQLELLSLDGLEAVLSLLEGEHAGVPRAQFAELTDYRNYQPGDDPRLIDWNAYARLGELFVRTSSAHEGLLLTLLVDCSRSMAVPGPWGGKLRYAKRLAAAFGAVALLHSDAVRVCVLTDGTATSLPVLSGRTALGRLLDDLEWLPAGGTTDLASSVRACQLEAAGSGLAVLLSDLLMPAGQDEALDWLGRSGTAVHVIDSADADPLSGFSSLSAGFGSSAGPARGADLTDGSVELRDSETGEVVVTTVTPALRRRYAELSAARAAELAARCAAAGVRYLRAETTTPVADLLFGFPGVTAREPA